MSGRRSDSPSVRDVRDSGGDRAGSRIGPFLLGRCIGEGAMGVVYEATDAAGERVAVKLLRGDLAVDADRRKRFLREARVAAAMDHPNVARVRDVGEADDQVFLAMDLVRGQNLRDRIDAAGARPLPIDEALAIVRGILRGVAHAHEKGVVHRDLKPDNVMLTEDGVVKVLDFGLAKLRATEHALVYEEETKSTMTRDGHVIGTPGYMAPEQATGKEVGFRADIFSIGVIFYEMFTGVRPFRGASAMEVIIAITRDPPEKPSSLNPEVRPALEAVMLKCLAKSASARPESALALLDEIDAALTSSQIAPASVRNSPAPRSRRLLVGIVASCAIVAAIVGLTMRARTTPMASIPAPSASAIAPAAPTTMLDLPLPPSDVPAALAAFREGVQAERDGLGDVASDAYEKAATLDPSMALANLRYAIRNVSYEAGVARTAYRHAVEHRSQLDPRDRDLLDAFSAVFVLTPPDYVEWARRLEALTKLHPNDAELWFRFGWALSVTSGFAPSRDACARAIEIDPRFALAWEALAEAEAYAGDFVAARESIDRCLGVSEGSTSCLWLRQTIEEFAGECAADEVDARRRIASAPEAASGYTTLVFSLAAQGRPPAVTREAMRQAASKYRDPFARRRYVLSQTLRLDALEGDFTSAAQHAEDLIKHVATSNDIEDHGLAAECAVETYVEMGRLDRAARIAEDFLARRDAWQSIAWADDYSLARDPSGYFLAVARRAGRISPARFESDRDAWVARWSPRLAGDYRAYLWVAAYADSVESHDDAVRALALLKDYGGATPKFFPNGATTGLPETLLLAGRADEALAYLDVMSHDCSAGVHPTRQTRARLLRGQALEQRGDRAGACAAYADVIARWPHPIPRSVTVERARERSRALACAPR